jgi:mRNA interferase HicA
MKRKRLLKYLREHGCEVVKEGGDHTWVRNEATRKKSFVPRHAEIKAGTVKGICRQLGIDPPKEK